MFAAARRYAAAAAADFRHTLMPLMSFTPDAAAAA